MRATLSLLGIYNEDNTILDGLTLPDNFDSGDLNILKNNLLIETAEFEILYTEPAFLKLAITEWCNKRKSTWKWLRDTQLYEYNPIWNADYNRYNARDLTQTEDEVTDFTRTLRDSKSGDDTTKLSGDDTSLHSVYAFNEQSTPAPESTDKVDYGRQDKTTYNSHEDHTGTTKTVRDFDRKDLENNHEVTQGNYGTTTTQYMIREEQELAKFNMLDYIITDFKKRFCLLVY